MKNFSGVCQAAGADKPLRAFFIWITNIVTLAAKHKPRQRPGFFIGILTGIDISNNPTESECLYRSQSWTGASKNSRKCLYGSRKWTCTSTVGETRASTAPTLNRSTWSEAKAPSGARPGRVFDDEGGRYGKANRPRGCMRGQSPLY